MGLTCTFPSTSLSAISETSSTMSSCPDVSTATCAIPSLISFILLFFLLKLGHKTAHVSFGCDPYHRPQPARFGPESDRDIGVFSDCCYHVTVNPLSLLQTVSHPSVIPRRLLKLLRRGEKARAREVLQDHRAQLLSVAHGPNRNAVNSHGIKFSEGPV